MSTALSVCEQRDPKGLYAKVRKGELAGFTGMDDPYEPPTNQDIEIDTSQLSINEAVRKIIAFLIQAGYLIDDIGAD